jgi:hypothetical protein
MERRAFLLGMLGALTAAAGFAVTTTAPASSHVPLAADGATDANDVKAEDLVNLRTDYAQYYRRRARRVYRRYYRRPARRYYRRAGRRYYY